VKVRAVGVRCCRVSRWAPPCPIDYVVKWEPSAVALRPGRRSGGWAGSVADRWPSGWGGGLVVVESPAMRRGHLATGGRLSRAGEETGMPRRFVAGAHRTNRRGRRLMRAETDGYEEIPDQTAPLGPAMILIAGSISVQPTPLPLGGFFPVLAHVALSC
jgi:hypothetical protein